MTTSGTRPGAAVGRRRPSLSGLIARLIALVVVVVVLFVGTVAVRIWWTARSDDRRPSDAIVVLGASQLDGTPSSIFRNRLNHARALYEQGVAPRIVTTGGRQPDDRYTEGEAGRNWLIAEGVPPDAVVAVGEGRDTVTSLEAAETVFEQQGWQTAVIVSDPWHSFRSRAIARDVGMDAVTSPTRSGPAVQTREVQARYIARETVAYIYYELGGSSQP
ncbi:MAG TPA: YdcF family protein [Actinomycetes bacterium]|nr:YdcF family protein [Actinomycetes bacterium]